MESVDVLYRENSMTDERNKFNSDSNSINSSTEETNRNIEEVQRFLLNETCGRKSCSSNEQLLNKQPVTDTSTRKDNTNFFNDGVNKSDVNDHISSEMVNEKGEDAEGYFKETNNVEDMKEEKNMEEVNSKKNEEEDGWMDILGSGSLKKKVIKAGIPDTRPQKSDLCTLSYICELEDGSFIESEECITINMGDYEINQGIDFALALMDKDEESYILITSRFGYGNEGRLPSIPSKATLLYKVRLLDVKKEEIQELDLSSRVQKGLKKKERGNFWYQRGDHTCAIHCYRRALDYFDDTEIPGTYSEKELHAMLEERLKVYNNLAASQTVIGALDAALISVNNVLSCQPKNIKALFRKSKVLREKGEIEECIKVVRQGLEADPENSSFKKELSNLLAVQRAQNNRQKELYKKMMGGRSPSAKKENRKKQANNTLKWITIASFTVAVLGALVIKYRY